jgi:hypothetical protein
MIVHFADNLDRSKFAELIARLEAESFAAGCIIFAIEPRTEPRGQPEEQNLSIKLPNSRHGVLLTVGSIDAGTIDWAIEALRLSVNAF